MSRLVLLLPSPRRGDGESDAARAEEAGRLAASRLHSRIRVAIAQHGETVHTVAGPTAPPVAALIAPAGSSELYARFTSVQLSRFARPVWRVRLAGCLFEDAWTIDVSILRRNSGQRLGRVRHIEARRAFGTPIQTILYVADDLPAYSQEECFPDAPFLRRHYHIGSAPSVWLGR